MVDFEQNRIEVPAQNDRAETQKAWGPTIGLIIILILIIVGSLYFFRKENASNTGYNKIDSVNNNIESIEADLNSTDFGDMESELNSAEKEMNQI